MPSLFVLSGNEVGRTFDFDAAIRIGRAKEAELTVRAPSVSRIHARIEPTADGWIVVDANSSNGVWVDHQRVEQGVLTDGASFRLGDLELRFRTNASADPARPDEAFDPNVGAAATAFFDQESIEDALESDHAPQVSAPVADESDEIELEGDWSDEPVPVQPSAASAPAPKPTTAPAASAAASVQVAQDQARRKAAALGGSSASGARATSSGGRILQYNKVTGGGGLFATDIGQQSATTRWLLYAGVLLVVVALAYGAYLMTTTMRRQATDDSQFIESED